jgi:hypothetical protein
MTTGVFRKRSSRVGVAFAISFAASAVWFFLSTGSGPFAGRLSMTATFRDDAYSPEVGNGYEMLLPSGLDIRSLADDEECGDLHESVFNSWRRRCRRLLRPPRVRKRSQCTCCTKRHRCTHRRFGTSAHSAVKSYAHRGRSAGTSARRGESRRFETRPFVR